MAKSVVTISLLCLPLSPTSVQRKVEQLQNNVREWKDSYDELMNELRKLTLERVVEKEELVKEVKVLSNDAKVRGHS